MGCKDITIIKSEYVTKTQFLYFDLCHLQGYAKVSWIINSIFWLEQNLKNVVLRILIVYNCLVSYEGVMKGADPMFKNNNNSV